MRAQILKDLLTVKEERIHERLTKGLLYFITMLLRSRTNTVIRPILFGASLTALKKKTCGIRPLAVGITFRRMAAKLVGQRIKKPITNELALHQLEVGIPRAAEIGAHAAWTYIKAKHKSPKVVLKLNFQNAFNEVIMLCAFSSHFLEAYLLIESCYREPSTLFFGSTSALGCQQGDPLEPTIFALVIQPIVHAIQAELNLFYLDDATIGDSPEVVLADLDVVQKMAAEVGLTLNSSKCEMAVVGARSVMRSNL
ncbi:hypothetical protein ILUMI_10547 [Ignelater luminosus]|uniref:Reverse transcriptase domain-containing protein n=1 Tax=Ignelater luminosus TaxID=2038154 RepID=A0A8K0D075_IGNLU|nr:hypothetical protein ILUMI_10547 [Ignelater luminosus]